MTRVSKDAHSKPRSRWFTKRAAWARSELKVAFAVLFYSALVLAMIASAHGRRPLWSGWRVASLVLWVLAGAVLVANALFMRRMKRNGAWPPTTWPASRPDEAYLVTLARWRRSRKNA
jgi:protein-S-isoprenylcysteine O-methyltransferase Ste14